LDLIILIILDVEYRSWSSSLCSCFPPLVTLISSVQISSSANCYQTTSVYILLSETKSRTHTEPLTKRKPQFLLRHWLWPPSSTVRCAWKQNGQTATCTSNCRSRENAYSN
jgi:hypothetical protein